VAEEKAKVAFLPLLVRLCSDKAAFEVLVLRKVVFNLNDAKQRLEKASECKIRVYTPHLMILRWGTAEVTLSRDGKMLIKWVRDENEARLVACRVWQTIAKTQC